MAVTAKLYGKVFANVFGGETAGESSTIDWLSNTIKVSLHTASYTPNQDTHEFQSDLTNECAATGNYATGGATLANKTLTYTAGTNTNTFDADDVTWASSTITARYAVIYNATPGSSATNPLIGYIDFGADVSSNNGNFTIQFDSAGIFTVSVS